MTTDTALPLPKADEKALALSEKRYLPVVQKAMKVVITDPKEMKQAAEDLTMLNKELDGITKLKETMTKPLNAALKTWRSFFKPREEQLDKGISALRSAMSQYQMEADRKAREEEAKIAARVGEGKGHIKPETAVAKMDQIDRPAEQIETSGGGVKFREDKKLKITSHSKLLAWAFKHMPTALELNEAEILRALKEGVIADGAEIEIVKTVVNSR